MPVEMFDESYTGVCMIRYSLLLTVICIGTVALQLWVSQMISKKRVNITRVLTPRRWTGLSAQG